MKKLPGISIILLFTALTVFAAFQNLQPDKIKPETAPPGEFASGRAMQHLNVIAARPHPTGFVANRLVMDFLVKELKLAGLQPDVQQATVEKNDNFNYIENIIAIKRGTDGKNAKKILLSAHYDARGEAPGAGDNGYAVSAILEMLRALKSYPPLKNDLIIFLPDGEELGSLGAKAFINENPLSDSIDLVLNFDGRGSSGTSLMFETSGDNYELIKEFNNAESSSFSNSLSDEVYRLIPNYTDFTWFMKKSRHGLNFAHVETVENYHTANDDIANFDERTLQSHGNTMLACVLHFGNINLKVKSQDAVYFHLLLPDLIVYPSEWTIFFAFLALFIFVLVFYTAYRNNKVTITKTLAGAGIFLVKVIGVAVAVHFIWKEIGPRNVDFGKFELDWVSTGDYYLAGFLAAGLVVYAMFQKKMLSKTGIYNTTFGILLVWLMISFATAFYFRGGSYLFIWPLISSLIPLFIISRKEKLVPSLQIIILLMIFAIPGIYLFSQIIFLFYETMTLRMAGAIAALFMIILGTLQMPFSIILNDQNPEKK